jgi:hypothetical protein
MQNYKYDPTTDTALKQAQDQASKAIMEQMAGRGILNSTITNDRVSQSIQDLIPQYEQLAYENQGRLFNRMLQSANYVMQLSDQEYKQYRDNVEDQFQKEQFNYQKQQDAIDNKMKEVSQAWERVQNLGYVDNKAAQTLGVAAGTKSWEAKKLADQQAYELSLIKKQNEQAMVEKMQNYMIENNVAGLRSGMSSDELMNMYNKAAPQISAQNAAVLQNTTEQAQLKSFKSNIDKLFVSKNDDGKYVVDKKSVMDYILSLSDYGVSDNVTEQLALNYGITDYDWDVYIGKRTDNLGALAPSERGRILSQRGIK